MRDQAIPNYTKTGGMAVGRALQDLPPCVTPEQAAADKAWTIQAVKDGRLRAQTLPELRGETKKPRLTPAKQRGNRTTQEEVDQMRAEGNTDESIADHFGIHVKTLRNRHGAAGTSGRLAPQIREVKKQQARRLIEQGTSQTRAAQIVGVTQQTASKWFAGEGIAA